MCDKRTTVRLRSGFTLVELLVVIGIIAVLIAILLPTLSAARVSGMQSVSSSNLRQIGIALRMYANDNKGSLPETTHSTGPAQSWIFTLAPYLDGIARVRICPADPRMEALLNSDGTSYILNEYVAVKLTDPFGQVIEDFTRLDKIRRPSEVFTVFVSSDRQAAGVFADHTHSRGWTVGNSTTWWNRVLGDIQPDRFRTRTNTPLRDRGSAPYLFADSHVEVRQADQMRKLILEGINFAKPPTP
jgi:prepilin-type N-terminal cleavage/methylation domain-containing protein